MPPPSVTPPMQSTTSPETSTKHLTTIKRWSLVWKVEFKRKSHLVFQVLVRVAKLLQQIAHTGNTMQRIDTYQVRIFQAYSFLVVVIIAYSQDAIHTRNLAIPRYQPTQLLETRVEMTKIPVQATAPRTTCTNCAKHCTTLPDDPLTIYDHQTKHITAIHCT